MIFEVRGRGVVSQPGRLRGRTIGELLAAAGPTATHVTVVSEDGYRASIPIETLRASGRLSRDERGQRLHVVEGATLCWNVKAVVAFEFTEGSADDDVPANPPH